MCTFLQIAEWKADTSWPPNSVSWSLSRFWVSLLQNQIQGEEEGRATTQSVLLLQPKMVTLWYCTLACKNTIFHPATSGISCSLPHLYIVGKLRATELPSPKPRAVLFLGYWEQKEIAPLWLVYPDSADRRWMIQWGWWGREQRTPSSERSSWTNLLPSVPLW